MTKTPVGMPDSGRQWWKLRRPTLVAGPFWWRFPPGSALLYALALEIDERMATPIGRVCRACGGRGAVIVDVRRAGQSVWSVGQVHHHDLDLHGIDVDGDGYYIHRDFAVATQTCACAGSTRPDTIELHRLVSDLANLPRPRFEWPAQWLIDLDSMLDGRDDRPDWMVRWWLAFREWSHAGKLPDADALAADLAELLPELEAREAAKRMLKAVRRRHIRLDDTDNDISFGPGGRMIMIGTPWSSGDFFESIARTQQRLFVDGAEIHAARIDAENDVLTDGVALRIVSSQPQHWAQAGRAVQLSTSRSRGGMFTIDDVNMNVIASPSGGVGSSWVTTLTASPVDASVIV